MGGGRKKKNRKNNKCFKTNKPLHLMDLTLHFPRPSIFLYPPEFFCGCTLPETNSSPLKIGLSKRKGSASNHPSSGANLLLVSDKRNFYHIDSMISSPNKNIRKKIPIWVPPLLPRLFSQFQLPQVAKSTVFWHRQMNLKLQSRGPIRTSDGFDLNRLPEPWDGSTTDSNRP